MLSNLFMEIADLIKFLFSYTSQLTLKLGLKQEGRLENLKHETSLFFAAADEISNSSYKAEF